MLTGDTAKRQLAATSQFRQRPVLEWSKQISRTTAPFFLSSPMPNLRQNYGSEGPKRHVAVASFDRTTSRDDHSAPPVDTRDYSPTRYEELHPHVAVNIQRNVPRNDIFTRSGGAESSLDPFAHPGWINGKGSFAKADKGSYFGKRTSSPDVTYETDYGHKVRACVFGQAERATSIVVPDHRTPLNVSSSAVSRHSGEVRMSRSSSRLSDAKPSESYRSILVDDVTLPQPAPKRRITPGFAPTRYNHRLTLQNMIDQAASDVKRAQSVMDAYFGDRSRSELRRSYLYTPEPNASAIQHQSTAA